MSGESGDRNARAMERLVDGGGHLYRPRGVAVDADALRLDRHEGAVHGADPALGGDAQDMLDDLLLIVQDGPGLPPVQERPLRGVGAVGETPRRPFARPAAAAARSISECGRPSSGREASTSSTASTTARAWARVVHDGVVQGPWGFT
jgi:hypothetical protein